jgi:Tol biopolymer transport system component
LEWAACGSESDIKDPCKVAIGSPDSAERHRMPGGEGGGYLCCVYWPPDESLVVVPADNVDALAVGNPDGSDLRPLAADDPLAKYLLATRNDPGRTSPDGRQYLDVVAHYQNGRYTAPELWLAAPTGGDRRKLATLELGARVLGTAWSPDGETIAISKLPDGGANQLWLLGLDGSLRQPAAPTGFEWGSAALPGEWSPDGTQLAIGMLRGDPADRASQSIDTVIVPIDGSAPVVLRDARRAHWSPDGASIAFVATTGPFDQHEGEPVRPATIEVANADGSNDHQVFDPGRNDFWFVWAAP